MSLLTVFRLSLGKRRQTDSKKHFLSRQVCHNMESIPQAVSALRPALIDPEAPFGEFVYFAKANGPKQGELP
jgi:hypothetical protein